ncbi:MAG: hypothetical protein AAGE65_13635 [Planctomycetota bacterium]
MSFPRFACSNTTDDLVAWLLDELPAFDLRATANVYVGVARPRGEGEPDRAVRVLCDIRDPRERLLHAHTRHVAAYLDGSLRIAELEALHQQAQGIACDLAGVLLDVQRRVSFDLLTGHLGHGAIRLNSATTAPTRSTRLDHLIPHRRRLEAHPQTAEVA